MEGDMGRGASGRVRRRGGEENFLFLFLFLFLFFFLRGERIGKKRSPPKKNTSGAGAVSQSVSQLIS
jgi:hypothetical protein